MTILIQRIPDRGRFKSEEEARLPDMRLSHEYIFMTALRTEKIKAAIEALRFAKMPEQDIKAYIIDRWDLTPTYAQNFLDDDSDPEDSRPWAL